MAEVQIIRRCSHTRRKEIEHFFSIYKALEDKRTEIAGWGKRCGKEDHHGRASKV